MSNTPIITSDCLQNQPAPFSVIDPAATTFDAVSVIGELKLDEFLNLDDDEESIQLGSFLVVSVIPSSSDMPSSGRGGSEVNVGLLFLRYDILAFRFQPCG